MTSLRLFRYGAVTLTAVALFAPIATAQTTPRNGNRPAPSGPQDSAAKGNKPGNSATANKSSQAGGKATTPSAQRRITTPDDDDAPRTATRPNSATRGDSRPESKPALPPGPNAADGSRVAPPQPVAPSWAPVPDDEAEYIDKVLKYWESSTSKIKTYKCDFEKFTYNPNFAPAGTYYEHSTGVIMYAQPDKGMYRVDTIDRYRAPTEQGGKPEWPRAEGEKGEHWICDGKAVFYHDYLNKILRKTKLPPVMQGKAIADGPLPFVFGAEAKKIKDRYWLHVTTPPNVDNEIHLAAVPKHRDDAANYKEIKIIIDHDSFLPKAMIVFMPNYDAKLHPAKDSYLFKKRENNIADALWLPLAKQFYQPSTPDGWKLEEQEVPRDEPAPKATVPAVTQKRPATANK